MLPRSESTSPLFTDGVLGDLARRGLVRRSVTRISAPWLAAAAVIFATGIGVGAVIATVRSASTVRLQSSPPNVASKVAADVNVPPVGHSEVWF